MAGGETGAPSLYLRATGLGYAVGLGSTALLARRLDVDSRQLGFGTAEYLFLAASGIALWAAAGLIFLAASSLNDKSLPITDTRRAIRLAKESGVLAGLRTGIGSVLWFLAGTAGQTALIVVASGVAILTGLDLLTTLMLVGGLSIMVWASRRAGHTLFLSIVTFAIVVTTLLFVAADGLGRDIRRYARGEIPELRTRFPYSALVNPVKGEAVVDGNSWCVVRVSGSVYVGGELVVVTSIDAFRATDCRVDDQPFAS